MAIENSTIATESKLTLRVKNCLEALEFCLKQAPDTSLLHYCVFKSTRNDWLELADSKLSLIMNAVEVLPGAMDFNLLWLSEHAYKMLKGTAPTFTKQHVYSQTVAERGELSEADRLW